MGKQRRHVGKRIAQVHGVGQVLSLPDWCLHCIILPPSTRISLLLSRVCWTSSIQSQVPHPQLSSRFWGCVPQSCPSVHPFLLYLPPITNSTFFVSSLLISYPSPSCSPLLLLLSLKCPNHLGSWCWITLTEVPLRCHSASLMNICTFFSVRICLVSVSSHWLFFCFPQLD